MSTHKRIFKRKRVSAEPRVDLQAEPQVDLQVESKVEPKVMVVIGKMQQQLVSLEKKIDILLSKSSERPAGGGGSSYSKPFQRFDRGNRFGRGGQDSNFRERIFTKVICTGCKTECEVPFKPTGDRPVYCKDCFDKRKEEGGSSRPSFEHKPRGGGFAKERSFDKPQGREGYRPGGRAKPSFRRRKERV